MREKFDDNCKGCEPIMLDARTGKPWPPDSPQMKAAMSVWSKTTREERLAFHRVTCLNSRDENDIRVIHEIAGRIEAQYNTAAHYYYCRN